MKINDIVITKKKGKYNKFYVSINGHKYPIYTFDVTSNGVIETVTVEFSLNQGTTKFKGF